jgi:hypothetical protein
VYERLAPGILKELEPRNPKDEQGNCRGKHHQLLTDDIGTSGSCAASSRRHRLHARLGNVGSVLSDDESRFPQEGQTIELALGD